MKGDVVVEELILNTCLLLLEPGSDSAKNIIVHQTKPHHSILLVLTLIQSDLYDGSFCRIFHQENGNFT